MRTVMPFLTRTPWLASVLALAAALLLAACNNGQGGSGY